MVLKRKIVLKSSFILWLWIWAQLEWPKSVKRGCLYLVKNALGEILGYYLIKLSGHTALQLKWKEQNILSSNSPLPSKSIRKLLQWPRVAAAVFVLSSGVIFPASSILLQNQKLSVSSQCQSSLPLQARKSKREKKPVLTSNSFSQSVSQDSCSAWNFSRWVFPSTPTPSKYPGSDFRLQTQVFRLPASQVSRNNGPKDEPELFQLSAASFSVVIPRRPDQRRQEEALPHRSGRWHCQRKGWAPCQAYLNYLRCAELVLLMILHLHLKG